jgi:hypothetical protein
LKQLCFAPAESAAASIGLVSASRMTQPFTSRLGVRIPGHFHHTPAPPHRLTRPITDQIGDNAPNATHPVNDCIDHP